MDRVEHSLTLEYSLAPGWMAPFAEGLKEARAIARQCEACQSVSFPPLRVCLCGASGGDWVELDGAATILFRCHGQDGEFALVHFEGATTKSTVKLLNFPSNETIGGLLPMSGSLVQLQLTSLQKETP